MRVLVTGAKGFIGKNLVLELKSRGHEVFSYDLDSSERDLHEFLGNCDFLMHLAGINRPLSAQEFYDGNTNFTKKLLDMMDEVGSKAPILFSSSTKAASDDDYGKSKRMAEELLFASAKKRDVHVYRLYNVYGKWCRPGYNSVIATWCDAVARDLPISINENDPAIDFVYIDDVVSSFIETMEKGQEGKEGEILYVEPHDNVHLSRVLSLLRSFKASRKSLEVPLQEGFEKKLYATYLSYLDANDFSYPLSMHIDQRGSFTECLHFPSRGQVSINVSHPGITKGNHYHKTKNEKFLCVSGEVLIAFRKIGAKEIIEYRTSEKELKVVDIPPGYTHSITTLGKKDSVTLMWANESFDPSNPDTYSEDVLLK